MTAVDNETHHVGVSVQHLVDTCWEAADRLGWHEEWYSLREDIAHKTRSEKDAVAWVVGKLFLSIGELSEAGEELRNGQGINEVYYSAPGDTTGIVTDRQQYNEEGVPLLKPEGFLVEVADAVIRLLDLVGVVDVADQSFGGILAEKLAYNATRGQMHGGKKF
jgi:hypothetical protein